MANVTFQGNPLKLVGEDVKVGAAAPAFSVVDGALKPVTQEVLKGKVTVLSAVPSLDTPVCEVQTKKFNEEVSKLGGAVQLLTISVDLPFAQKRFCAAHKTERVTALSDYQQRSFGKAWGLLIDGLALLARAVFVVDKTGTVRYAQVVPEVTHEPDYAGALAAVKKLL
jgi:thiol peroxidase